MEKMNFNDCHSRRRRHAYYLLQQFVVLVVIIRIQSCFSFLLKRQNFLYTTSEETVLQPKKFYDESSASDRDEKPVGGNSILSQQQENEWYDAVVTSVEYACPSKKSLLWKVQVPENIGSAYTNPGQFLRLRWNTTTDPLFLAMSSTPTTTTVNYNTFQFLVKTTPNIPWLLEIQSNMKVQLSNVMGKGFVLDKAIQHSSTPVEHLVLVAAGSGIAPLLACLHQLEDNKASPSGLLSNVQTITVYYGEWTLDDICFTTEFQKWQTNKMSSGDKQIQLELVPCLSRQVLDKDDIIMGSVKCYTGHVQDVLAQRGLNFDPVTSLALVCGMKEMQNDVIKLLQKAGVPRELILTNL